MLANRDVLIALAGVFFFLPTLLSGVFLADVQAAMMASLENEQALQLVMRQNMGTILAFSVGGMLVQGVGYLAIMALLSGQGRPTVGEAIMAALRALPCLIGATVLYFAGLFALTLVVSLVLGVLAGVSGAGGLVATLVAAILILAMAYTSIRLSLLTPVIVREGVSNPIHALKRSWDLTKGNALRLFGFFVLLFLGYMAISLVLSLFIITPVALLLGTGDITVLAGGIVSGLIGAVASIVITAVLVEAHDQLAGGEPGSEASTFE